jgi:hypothetical protein
MMQQLIFTDSFVLSNSSRPILLQISLLNCFYTSEVIFFYLFHQLFVPFEFQAHRQQRQLLDNHNLLIKLEEPE